MAVNARRMSDTRRDTIEWELMQAPRLPTGLAPELYYSDVAYGPDGKQILVTCHKRLPVVTPALANQRI